ncbi:rhodanese-like domain-containing protein [Mesorhizobium sp. M0189]|uniref:rhodanese-like domain-containing protein n=1 Tax=unclassified Mesorhizobium TaxID=325217 RepID=UPI003335B484
MFAQGHIPGAINLPHGKIVRSKLERWSDQIVFVTYCAGPHCNGADRGALRLAELGRPVKIMAGGVTVGSMKASSWRKIQTRDHCDPSCIARRCRSAS